MGTETPEGLAGMSKRLPQPADAKRVRLVLSDVELEQAERMATDCRLSVASFVRALLVGVAADWPERLQATKDAATKVMADMPADHKRPGRPPAAKGKPRGKK